jgi:hypothetical protein
MANTLNFGSGKWAAKEGSVLAYNDLNDNFKPLPFTFTRASTATRVNESGLIESVASGVPRIDFLDNADGHLLLEPSRTNLVTYSEDFKTAWTRTGIAPPTLESISAPNGSSSVYRLTTNNSDGSLSFTYNTGFSQTSGITYTITVYAKSYSGENQLFGLYGNGSGASDAHSGNLTATSEWQRFTYTYTASNTSNAGICKGINELAFDILFWGFQVEAGSYATSYIPTSGSSVTRAVDAASQTVPLSVIGQSEGTLFLDFNPLNNADALRYISIENSSTISNGWFGIFSGLNSGLVKLRFFGDGWNFYSPFGIEIGERYKVAMSYKNGVLTSVYVNGTSVGSLTASLSGKSFNRIRLSEAAIGTKGDAEFRDVKLYNTALSNSELAALTSL